MICYTSSPPVFCFGRKRKRATSSPPAVQYFGMLEKHCHWGNEVKLYEHHVDTLFAMFWHKKAHIKYLCTINKTFAKPGQRMVKHEQGTTVSGSSGNDPLNFIIRYFELIRCTQSAG